MFSIRRFVHGCALNLRSHIHALISYDQVILVLLLLSSSFQDYAIPVVEIFCDVLMYLIYQEHFGTELPLGRPGVDGSRTYYCIYATNSGI
jgi:hypothetical protein